ncbi:hypothetical protein Bbelb_185310 [Branchiostoma belcheri]|nr:hypothetical protein Bbelb_185310 [Branchiostoma belcheri]
MTTGPSVCTHGLTTRRLLAERKQKVEGLGLRRIHFVTAVGGGTTTRVIPAERNLSPRLLALSPPAPKTSLPSRPAVGQTRSPDGPRTEHNEQENTARPKVVRSALAPQTLPDIMALPIRSPQEPANGTGKSSSK